jgi:ribonucleotide monophosphatase NagD (HAD superfamily)
MKSMATGGAMHAILENMNGDMFPTQALGKPHEKTFRVAHAEAESLPIAESTRQINDMDRNQAVAQDNPEQIRTLTG